MYFMANSFEICSKLNLQLWGKTRTGVLVNKEKSASTPYGSFFLAQNS